MKQKLESNSSIQPAVEYLTRKEAASFLRISLAKFDQIKDLDRIRYGKSVRFSVKTLKEYAVKHTTSGLKSV